MSNTVWYNQNHLDYVLTWANRGGTVIVDILQLHIWTQNMKRGGGGGGGSGGGGCATFSRESSVKCVSSGTVILKGESVENKSTQQSWPIFMLECFQRQQSLFSYTINCLNRLPVEFLMCYKFRVCLPRVDSTQAILCQTVSCNQHWPWKNFNQRKPFRTLLSSTIVHKVGLSSATMESIHYICMVHQWPSAMQDSFVLASPIHEVVVKRGEGHWATCSDAKQIIPQRGEELDSIEGTSLAFFCLVKVQNQSSLQGFYL